MSKTFHYDDTLGFVRRTLRYGNAPTIIESTMGQVNSEKAINKANANTSNALNALDCVEERKKGEWDMFDLISSAYYGKGMYFKDNEIVYSRHSNKYMTVDEAIKEFISLINEENIAFVPSVTTTWADGEAPTYALQKRGKWIEHGEPNAQGQYETWYYHCSLCGQVGIKQYNYCPNCGANMRGES